MQNNYFYQESRLIFSGYVIFDNMNIYYAKFESLNKKYKYYEVAHLICNDDAIHKIFKEEGKPAKTNINDLNWFIDNIKKY